MRLVHVIPAITGQARGPSYTVLRLRDALANQVNVVTLAALDWAPLRKPPD